MAKRAFDIVVAGLGLLLLSPLLVALGLWGLVANRIPLVGALGCGAMGVWFLYAGLAWVSYEVVIDVPKGAVVFRSLVTRRTFRLQGAQRVNCSWTGEYYATFVFDGGRARVLQSIDGFDDLVGYLRIVNPQLQVTGF